MVGVSLLRPRTCRMYQMDESLLSVKSSFDSNSNRVPLIWGGLLLVWFIALCVVHDPRPLGAPEWAVGLVCSLTGISEPTSRVVVTFAAAQGGYGMIGVLLALPSGESATSGLCPWVLLSLRYLPSLPNGSTLGTSQSPHNSEQAWVALSWVSWQDSSCTEVGWRWWRW